MDNINLVVIWLVVAVAIFYIYKNFKVVRFKACPHQKLWNRNLPIPFSTHIYVQDCSAGAAARTQMKFPNSLQ